MKISKQFKIISLLVISTLFLVSCAPGINELVKVPNDQEYVAGFFRGLWHGMILFFTFVISLFNDNVSVYEVHNVGALYDLGFLLGVSIVLGGGAGAKKRSKKGC